MSNPFDVGALMRPLIALLIDVEDPDNLSDKQNINPNRR